MYIQAWKEHKPICRAVTESRGSSRGILRLSYQSVSNAVLSGASLRPAVLFLDIDSDTSSMAFYNPFIAALSKASSLVFCTTNVAFRTAIIASPPPAAVLVSETSMLLDKPTAPEVGLLIRYINAGGRVVLGCNCATFSCPPDLDQFFVKLGIPWRFGDYHRTTHHLQSLHPIAVAAEGKLKDQYSMKAVHLEGVAREDALYLPTEQSRTQSMVFPSTRVDQDQAPLALMRVGDGMFGWCGDVNAETATTPALIAMLGLVPRG